MSAIVKRLYAKHLLTGDRIIETKLVDSPFGPVAQFIVERPNTEELRHIGERILRLADDQEAAK